MAKQVDKHEFFDSEGRKVVVALLDNDGIRVRFESPKPTAVTWHATGSGKHSVTIITPQQEG